LTAGLNPLKMNKAIALAGGASVALTLIGAPALAQVNPATELDLPQVTVIGTTPLPGIGQLPEEVPTNVQTLSDAEIRGTRGAAVPGALVRALGSANLNDSQGNPFQADLDFRGFTASPVVGTPQGLTLLVDGVRANEAFGDTIDWDLIPLNAIAHVTVLPGSNPLFGLNTLGGAVLFTTKSGFEFPGTTAELTGGSFGRVGLAAETGGHGQSVDYYIAANLFKQTGWA